MRLTASRISSEQIIVAGCDGVVLPPMSIPFMLGDALELGLAEAVGEDGEAPAPGPPC
ncbi:hypothetical protein GCM10027596_37240 [Nocardioides korecus]